MYNLLLLEDVLQFFCESCSSFGPVPERSCDFIIFLIHLGGVLRRILGCVPLRNTVPSLSSGFWRMIVNENPHSSRVSLLGSLLLCNTEVSLMLPLEQLSSTSQDAAVLRQTVIHKQGVLSEHLQTNFWVKSPQGGFW